MILRVDQAEVCGSHSLQLVFNDGLQKRVNVLPLFKGPIFEPLRDPDYFALATLDPVSGTVTLPNKAEALRALASENGTPSGT